MTRRWLRMAAIAATGMSLLAHPAAAQQILRDAETEAFMADMSGPLVSAAGMEPRNVQVLVINDREINAFVAGGQYVWVHSGLIAQADNVNQLQGVVAHELGHIEGGHVIRSGEGIKEATSVTILSLVLGAAAIAAGGAEAGMEPKNVQVMVINDPEINAFVAGGQYVWVHSGLIAQADNVNQIQGVVAHELGHIEGGHIIRSGEGMKAATGITLLSLLV
ncbi:MAG TPA: M48 family metalloprotease, partial [Sphingobium sp.]